MRKIQRTLMGIALIVLAATVDLVSMKRDREGYSHRAVKRKKTNMQERCLTDIKLVELPDKMLQLIVGHALKDRSLEGAIVNICNFRLVSKKYNRCLFALQEAQDIMAARNELLKFAIAKAIPSFADRLLQLGASPNAKSDKEMPLLSLAAEGCLGFRYRSAFYASEGRLTDCSLCAFTCSNGSEKIISLDKKKWG